MWKCSFCFSWSFKKLFLTCVHFLRCDRILHCGNGMRLLSYMRIEHRLSDHRPVTASYMIEVEEFSPRKLQKALTFTDAEIEEEEAFANMGIDGRFSRLNFGEVSTLCVSNFIPGALTRMYNLSMHLVWKADWRSAAKRQKNLGYYFNTNKLSMRTCMDKTYNGVSKN